jgi:hypothetical protein
LRGTASDYQLNGSELTYRGDLIARFEPINGPEITFENTVAKSTFV